MTQPQAPPRIPVTVLGGYLGSGKTTLINQLLNQSTDGDQCRIAVLVNDFGTINIDAALISSQSDSVIELSNGCICCSLADGFVAALDQIHQRALADPSSAPRQLLIETSGVALPGAVAQYAYLPGFVLGSIIVTADGEQLLNQLANRYVGDTVRAQLRAADLVLISKTDLLSKNQIDTVASQIRSLSPATVVSNPAKSDLQFLLLGSRTPSLQDPPDPPEIAIENQNSGPQVSLKQIELRQPVDQQQVERWLRAAPPSVARVKGILEAGDGPLRVDRVGSSVRIQAAPNQADASVVGTLIILSLNALPESDQILNQWLGESPAKL